MRLTKKFGNIYVNNIQNKEKLDFEERKNESIRITNSIYDKFGQLEDIETELGIDLTLRHKVETSEKLYCRDNKGEIVETRYYYSYGKDGVGLELPMDIEPYWCVSSYHWKDYGKTWALTKEELL